MKLSKSVLKIYKFLFLSPKNTPYDNREYYAKKVVELKNTERRKPTHNKIRVAGVEPQ